ncbi:MAG TPA: polyphosphate kinase 2 family protein [Terriglobia bacterium]|nr:polyphosphate kinase 2 family protein [Terriglobia bacterium]
MDYRKRLIVEPGTRVKLGNIDPAYRGKQASEKEAQPEIQRHLEKLRELQFLLYAEKKHSLLIVLQALDAAGKDGAVNHVLSALNPQGTTVVGFKKPTEADLNHDFLWRIHPHTPGKGEVAIFNRSYYEDVLVVRVHRLAPKEVWRRRYEFINNFEKLLRRESNTHVVKLFLHISRDEQLERFRQRLDDPARNWKISEADYKEREYWDAYTKAFEDVFAETSTKHAPWYIIPSNHKWFRNLAVSQIVAATLEDLRMKMPQPQVDLDAIRKQYHQAEEESMERS